MVTSVARGRRVWLTLWRTSRRIWLKGRYYLLLGGATLLGCEQPAAGPMIVTQMAMVEGTEIIVTRIVRQTVQVPVTPVVMPAAQPVVLELSYEGDFPNLDPQLALDANGLDLVENLFASLVRYNLQTGRFEPELAERWTVSGDGLTWTFHLREDIFWLESSGGLPLAGESARPVRPVSATDVVLAIQRVCDSRVRTPDAYLLFLIDGCARVYDLDDPRPEELDGIAARALDDNSVEITLTEPAAYFLAISSMALMRPVPVEKVFELGDEWAMPDNLVASGPFMLSRESVPGTQTVLVRNPYWPISFNGNVDRVNLLQLSADEAYDLWARNRLDLAPVPEENQAQILNRHAPRVELVPGQAVFYLAFNHDSPAFSSPELRRAFSAAIDRDRLVREVHGGEALPMRHLAPPGIFGAPPIDEVGTGYSPDLARKELAASHFGDCRLIPPVRILVSSSDLALQQAELVREMWTEELGCLETQFTIEQVQFGALLANTQASALDRPDMWELGWASAYPDENNWVGEVLHCTDSENRQRRPCSQIDDIIRQAAVLDAQDGRVDLYRQIERALFGDGGEMPLIPLFVRAEYSLRQGWVNYRPAPFGGEQFDTYFVDAGVKELERGR